MDPQPSSCVALALVGGEVFQPLLISSPSFNFYLDEALSMQEGSNTSFILDHGCCDANSARPVSLYLLKAVSLLELCGEARLEQWKEINCGVLAFGLLSQQITTKYDV